MPVPFLVLGDSPYLPTGLGRIARDLCAQLHRDREALDLDLVQVGWHPTTPESPTVDLQVQYPWPTVLSWSRGDDWLASVVQRVYQDRWGNEPGIVFSVWDPARCLPLAHTPFPADTQKWGYFAIDATNLHGRLSGPPASTLRGYDRLLGYTTWGTRVLQAIRPDTQYLPHGISASSWSDPAGIERARPILGARWFDDPQRIVVGIVATNQPRKDWAVALQTLKELRERGTGAVGWLHTDKLVGDAWSLPQLIDDLGLAKAVKVTTSDEKIDDGLLAALYQSCAVTLAPGLGEGFGYPIVESLAAGTPAVHHTYGGGAELVPMPAWKAPVRTERLESIYALKRPVLDPQDLANAIERAIGWRQAQADGGRAYCQGSVAHLEWTSLWPRWRAWVKAGIAAWKDGN